MIWAAIKGVAMSAKSVRVAGVIWGLVGATVTVVAFLGYMAAAGKKFRTLFVDQVTISRTVPVIYSYKYTIFGTFSPPRDRLVRLYIHPHDGTRPIKFWMQPPVTEAGGSWQFEARFGNPFWHDMVGRSPLKYDVFAGLFKRGTKIPGSKSGPIEIEEGEDFGQWRNRCRKGTSDPREGEGMQLYPSNHKSTTAVIPI
jgi:hypothetical protein